MLFAQLADLIRDKYGAAINVRDSARATMLLFSDGPEEGEGEGEAVYVVPDLPSALSAARAGRSVLLFCPAEERAGALEALRAAAANAVVCDEEKRAEALNFTQLLLSRSLRESDNYAVFLRMVINGRDLSYVLTEAARQCSGSGLVAVDFSGKILAHSAPTTDFLREWQYYIKNGYCPSDFMQHCYEMLLKRTEITPRAYSYHCEESDIYYLSSPIVINGTAQGYVFMLSATENRSTIAYEIMQIMSRVAADCISRNHPDLSGSTQLYRRLITDILGGEPREAVAERVTAGRFAIPALMRVVVVKPIYYGNETELFRQLSTQLSAVFRSSPPIQYKRTLLLLVPGIRDGSEAAKRAGSALHELAETNRLQIGISNVFDSLADLPQFYGQAREAILLAERLRLDEHTVYYHDVAFYSLVAHLSEGTRLRDFCHAALPVLQAYDAANGTELFETARVYIETGCSQKATSELLHAHRNTISYRRGQIQELTGIDFNDPEELFQLNYSFRIYEYLK